MYPDQSKLFALYQGEYIFIQKLTELLQRIIAEISMTPREMLGVAKLMLFIKRLPKTTPEIDINLNIVYSVNREHTYCSIAAEENYLTLGSGGSIYSEGIGSDSYTDAHFEFGTNGYRSEKSPDNLYPRLMNWFEAFDDLLGYKCRIDVEDIKDTLDLPWDDLTTPQEWDHLALESSSQ